MVWTSASSLISRPERYLSVILWKWWRILISWSFELLQGQAIPLCEHGARCRAMRYMPLYNICDFRWFFWAELSITGTGKFCHFSNPAWKLYLVSSHFCLDTSPPPIDSAVYYVLESLWNRVSFCHELPGCMLVEHCRGSCLCEMGTSPVHVFHRLASMHHVDSRL